ncbi:uncharacterized protein LOC114358787 [Ostrinia furnacalis]|uniref:uncharacterized protein LOC114358787 n=1 Tax=Ostrinia furnacalis TaxID=93504 RepID=UPI001040AA4E|nr:uncharacterized protein LOC114358787 [Ostrinia furnacalis]
MSNPVSQFISSFYTGFDELNCTYFDNQLIEICETVEAVYNREKDFDPYFDKYLVKICEFMEKTIKMEQHRGVKREAQNSIYPNEKRLRLLGKSETVKKEETEVFDPNEMELKLLVKSEMVIKEEKEVFDPYFDKYLVEICEKIEKTVKIEKVEVKVETTS